MKKPQKPINLRILAYAAILILITLILPVISTTTKIEWIASIAIMFILVSRSNITSIGSMVYLIKSKAGINAIDKTAKKHIKFWNAFADWGLTVSLGLIAYPLFRERMDKRMFVLGLLTIVAIFFVVFSAQLLSIQFINVPQIQDKLATSLSCVSSVGQPATIPTIAIDPTTMLILAIFLIGGLAFLVPLLLLVNASSIIIAAVSSIHVVGNSYNYTGAYNAINSQIPGAAPLIPGLTISFFAGIIAIIIIISIHEFSHGILARISKIKIKSTGLLLLFGVIPIGAFVEPNEKEVKKLSKVEQNRISIAGVSANLLATMAFLVILVVFADYVIPAISTYSVLIYQTVPGYPAYNVITPGSQLISIDNHTISNLSSVTQIESSIMPFSVLNVLTSKGDYAIQTNSQGKIGVYLCETSAVKSNNVIYAALDFIFIVVALLFLLNFSIAAVNLLPIPGFDGWRIYSLELKDKLWILFIIEVFVLAAIAINILPLLTYLGSVL